MSSSKIGSGGDILLRALGAIPYGPFNLMVPAGNCADASCAGLIGSGLVNMATGTHLFRITLPLGGPADFPIELNYVSVSTNRSVIGNKWSASYQRSALRFNPTVDGSCHIFNGLNEELIYGTRDAGTGYYSIPSGAMNAVQNTLWGASVNGPWVETQPDGVKFNYLATGYLNSIQSKGGARWTFTYDGSGNPAKITDPAGRRTSFAYDGSGNVRRVQDAGGRVTSFSVDANNDLVKVVSPELCVTSLLYYGSPAHYLRARIDPLGNTTTFTYGTVSGHSGPKGEILRDR